MNNNNFVKLTEIVEDQQYFTARRIKYSRFGKKTYEYFTDYKWIDSERSVLVNKLLIQMVRRGYKHTRIMLDGDYISVRESVDEVEKLLK